jgi:hypothetical protein
LGLLQPINTQMNQAFSEFQESGVVTREERTNQQNPSTVVTLKRYVRRTLDKRIHEREFEVWKWEQMRQHNQNTTVLSFEELYERFTSRKRSHDEMSDNVVVEVIV